MKNTPTVKPLVWEIFSEFSENAKTFHYTYQVMRRANGLFDARTLFQGSFSFSIKTFCNTPEEAKALCQAHWEETLAPYLFSEIDLPAKDEICYVWNDDYVVNKRLPNIAHATGIVASHTNLPYFKPYPKANRMIDWQYWKRRSEGMPDYMNQ